jgi:hypothetical protein
LHSLLSFMGQFLPLFLQPAGLSAAKETVHIAASKMENRIFVLFFMHLVSAEIIDRHEQKITDLHTMETVEHLNAD